MIEQVTNGILFLINEKNIKELACNSLVDFVNLVLNQDHMSCTSYVDIALNTTKLLWQIPNAIFWDKMYKFMKGTFSDYETQIKMCQKFQTDSKHYKEFVKKQIQIIEKLDFDCKVEWFSNLTRALLLEAINEEDYFKLSFALRMISSEDLLYIKQLSKSKDTVENSVLSVFYQHSLVNKTTPTTYGCSTSEYNISDLGLKMLKYGISFGDDNRS